MEQLKYIYTFLYRIKWWLLIAPLVVTGLVIWGTRNLDHEYAVSTTIYTGVVSGYGIDTEDPASQNWNILNNTLENIINIITSKETLKDVSLKLYVQNMIYGDPDKDNTYITAEHYRELVKITPKLVLDLIDKSSEEQTIKNLRAYEQSNSKNFVYGLFNWHHPHYSFEALSKISVKKLGNSDMLEITYSADDPGIAYNTLVILNKTYVDQYKDIQFGTTNNIIRYFEGELERVGHELRTGEDSLTNYNVANRVINYEEQTKQVAALDRDFELRYQDVLLDYNSSQALSKRLESQISENVAALRNNTEFLAKLNTVSALSSQVAQMESFYPDSAPSLNSIRQMKSFKNQLSAAENDLREISSHLSTQKYTKDGYPTSNFVSQWLDQLLKLEKATAELKVMDQQKEELNKQYSHFSPIGSTIKRKERSIDFLERSYLSILTSLNTARLRLKSMEMNSASLKVLNAPTFPLVSEPSMRKNIVASAFLGSILFILTAFLLKELLNRTLRDKIRTERITSGKVLGAFPGAGKLGKRRHRKIYEDAATQHLANNLQNYFKEDRPNVINLISLDYESGKSLVSNVISSYWYNIGLVVRTLDWQKDFSSASKEFLLSQSFSDIDKSTTESDILVVEYEPLKQTAVPKSLLQKANINLLVVDADKAWRENDQLLFDELKSLVADAPLMIYLTNADYTVVEIFTGKVSADSFSTSIETESN